jgi:ArsR family transcriptional regulator
MDPVSFYKNLSDDTRLRILLLTLQEQELCVCELTEAMQRSQPKISRHLAQLRNSGLLQDRRAGQWVYYRLHPQLPDWCEQLLRLTLQANSGFIADDCQRLAALGNRPKRTEHCC